MFTVTWRYTIKSNGSKRVAFNLSCFVNVILICYCSSEFATFLKYSISLYEFVLHSGDGHGLRSWRSVYLFINQLLY
jgi:hypothetical protein